MPFYRFSIRHGETLINQAAPLDLRDDAAAWEEATLACGEMLRGLVGSLTPDREWRMDVADETGAPVYTLRLISEWHR